VATDRTDFLITTSVDGHLKLWKKKELGIEFVKHYRAHLTPVTAVSASADGQLFASVSEDGSAKVFDVVNFGGLGLAFFFVPISDCNRVDMINIIKLGYTPHACCWVHQRGQAQALLAVSVPSFHEHPCCCSNSPTDPILRLVPYDFTMVAEVMPH
jgi:peptidylprolyl isomerase domain and WD repeat-containing protein 1